MHISAICFLFLIKLRQPKKKRLYEHLSYVNPNSTQPTSSLPLRMAPLWLDNLFISWLQTVIHLEFYATAVSEKHFKNALEYKPERWLRENKREINAFAFLPFGFGPRMCIGNAYFGRNLISGCRKLMAG